MARPHSGLTPREQRIMQLYDAGRGTLAIARELALPRPQVSRIVATYSEGDQARRYKSTMAAGSAAMLAALQAAR